MADAEFDNMDASEAEETLEDNDGRAARTVPYHQPYRRPCKYYINYSGARQVASTIMVCALVIQDVHLFHLVQVLKDFQVLQEAHKQASKHHH